MSSDQTDSSESSEALLAVDDQSFGAYPFPLSAVDVGPGRGARPVSSRSVRPVRLDGDKFNLPPGSTPVTRDVRIIPNGSGEVLSWVECPRNSAFGWFIEALPRFWLNRHRLTRIEKPILASGGTIDLAASLKRRERDRQELAQHANSLKCKLWTIRYHRDNLRSAIADCESRPHERNFHLVRANAEFTAHDNECYALLDELARVLALLQRIRLGNGTPESFHDLHTRRADQETSLANVLSSTEWYEGFRMRRANSTHAFKAYASFSHGDGEVRLWQHPDRKIFAVPDLSVGGASATRVLADLAAAFDKFVLAFSVYLLGLFHEFDLVSMHIKEKVSDDAELVTVWTTRIAFSDDLPPGIDLLLDPDGGVEVHYDGSNIRMGPAGKVAD